MAKSVSKSQLKARALEYFREVERTGRELVVTDRGRPVLKIIPYREGLTVLDAILMVGGPTPFANQNGTKIIRVNGAGEKSKVRVKLKNLLKGDLSKNVILEPNDTIVVPQAWF